MSKVGPNRYSFPSYSCLFIAFERVYSVFKVFLKLVGKGFECYLSVVPASCAYDKSHIIEQIKSVKRRRLVVGHRSYPVPLVYGTLSLLSYLKEFFIIEGTSADYLKLRYGVSELVGDVFLGIFGDGHCMVERNVNDNAGDIQLNRQILVPFKQSVADIVASNNEIRQGNPCRG